jgi:hypothetical protein
MFGDLMRSMRTVLERDEHTPLTLLLSTVLSVFKCLKEQGQAWDVDLKHFYSICYQAVDRVAFSPNQFEDSKLLQELVQLMLIGFKQVPHRRPTPDAD